MELLEHTLSSIPDNLALDEALLEEAEDSPVGGELLRLWEVDRTAVIVGRSSRCADEVNLEFCHRRQIPVLRRCSGGTAVVILPGCLLYSVVLNLEKRPELRSVDVAHRYVLATVGRALARLGVEARHVGTSDLAVGDRKISGNSLRCKQRTILYHGTLLYRADLELIHQCLLVPPRQPEYRRGRSHRQFLANLEISAVELRRVLIGTWNATKLRQTCPSARVQQLVEQKYSQPSWNIGR